MSFSLRTRRVPAMLAFAPLLVVGCGGSESSSSPADAKSDVADTAVVDTGVDARPVIGAACTGPTDCASYCITDPRYTNGYCSVGIEECPAPGGGPDPCPSGSTCTNSLGFGDGAGHSDFCMRNCTKDADCRVAEGYACCGSTHAGNLVCVPRTYCPVDAGP